MLRRLLVGAMAAAAVLAVEVAVAAPVTFTFPAAPAGKALDGRLLLLLSTNGEAEPRTQIDLSADTQMVFGVDVENLRSGALALEPSAFRGYPIRSLADVPAGDYHVQAVLHVYETFKRADGHTVKLPMDRGEGQQWNEAPGNLYSTPVRMRFDPAAPPSLALDQVIPPITPPADTKYVRHLRVQSKLLSKFWGRPMHLTAHVLVPEGFDEHPKARFPLVVAHDHHSGNFKGFRSEPPDPDLKPDYSKRFKIEGYNRIQQQEEYAFYQRWISKDFPRLLIVYIDHANPYYDDSYAVDSANLGPYGEAIQTELLPAVEKKFRAIGEGWARFTYGGSTGGWEALAVQVFYPDYYNGAFAACPDPIDFRGMTNFNLYEAKNAYWIEGPHQKVLQPGQQDADGRTLSSLKANNEYEAALGSRGRSGQQWDIWHAVYGPVGSDGYPRHAFDKETGAIDPEVAAHWRDNYDLGAIVERDWAKLGPKLQGKIHLFTGTSDTYFLANGVHYFEERLKKLDKPKPDAEVAYGFRFEHCWNGDPTQPNHLTRLRYHTMYVERMLARMQKTAPKGADLSSWRY
jgi:hypothetical protein